MLLDVSSDPRSADRKNALKFLDTFIFRLYKLFINIIFQRIKCNKNLRIFLLAKNRMFEY
jgi:hypothetical protein